MIQGLKKKTAPGISGITYTLIQAAGVKAHEIFRTFAEICIKSGSIPEKWKISQIYPIPKEGEWHYNLSNVRPIALLETFRKCTTKILTRRLARIFCQNNILRGPNFAGLPGNSTEEPVHIINMLMEDAKENSKELWLVLQDMKKAFDSVSLTALKAAMERIKLPEITIKIILNLFQGRQSRIITHWGHTEAFVINDGIEQGEVLSPLVWRIFYDLLLERIQKDPNLGYTIEVSNPYNNSLNYSTKIS
jgi:hypothetical protein